MINIPHAKIQGILLLLLMLFLLPNFAFAKQQDLEANKQMGEMENQVDPSSYLAPISVEILNANYSKTNSKLELELELKNNKSKFLDLDKASLSLYRGEDLSEEGFLFEGMSLEYYDYADLDFLAPRELKTLGLSFDLPANLASSKYYAQIRVSDREYKNFGADHFDEAISINGTGGYMGGVSAYVRAAGEEQSLTAGQMLENDQSLSVVIPLGQGEQKNIRFLNYIQANDILLRASLRAINSDEIIREFVVDDVSTQEDEIEVSFQPSEDMPSGTFTATVDVLDTSNQSIVYPIQARWFRAEEVARIVKIDTGTNTYQAGDTLDLQATVAVLGFDEGERFGILAKLSGDGVEQIYERDYTYTKNKPEEYDIDFSDSVISDPIKVEKIELSLKSSKSGKLYDLNILDTSSKGTYIAGDLQAKKETQKTITSPISIDLSESEKHIMLAVFFIALGLMIIAIAIRRSGRYFGVVIFAIVFGSLFIFAAPSTLAACPAPPAICGAPPFPIMGLWASYNPPQTGYLGNYPQSISVNNLYAYIQCQTCLNGIGSNIGLEVQTAAGNPVGETCQGVAHFGHTWHWDPGFNYPGPFNFNYTFNAPGDYRYRVVINTSDGCKCQASSFQSQWYYVSVGSDPVCGITVPTDNQQFGEGELVNFQAVANPGLGGFISRYYWGHVRPGTQSHNETRCHVWDDAYDYSGDGHGDELYYPASNQSNFSITDASRLPVGNQKICTAVRQSNPDGSYSWCDDHVDIEIIEKPKCGTAANTPSHEAPAANLCLSSISSSVSSSGGYWRWTCSNATQSTNCSAPNTSFTFSVPRYVRRGSPAVLSWTTDNVDWCHGYDSGDSRWDTNQTHTNSNYVTWGIDTNTSFGFYCNKWGYDESSTKRITATVEVFDLDLYLDGDTSKNYTSIYPGDSITINWDPENVVSCEATNNVLAGDSSWDGAKAIAVGSSQTFVPSGGPGFLYYYNLNCLTSDATPITKTVSVDILPCDVSTCTLTSNIKSLPCTNTDCSVLGCETDPDCRNNQKEYTERSSSCGYSCSDVLTKPCSCGSSIGADDLDWEEVVP